ncbi:MAG: elongation factor P [Anaerolineae bacterium]|nr:elongation factor P [Anaerolineae bacterium]
MAIIKTLIQTDEDERQRMIDVNDLRKGVTFTIDGAIYRVLEYSHHKPGRGNATIRTTLRDLRTGATIQRTFISGDRVQDIRVESIPVEFLYSDGEMLHFMNTATYEQYELPVSIFGDDVLYLYENMQLSLSTYEGEVIDYELPTTVEHEVVEAEVAVAGNTATNATKKVKTQTGLQVNVPLFVNVGDKIRIDTRDGSYITRV